MSLFRLNLPGNILGNERNQKTKKFSKCSKCGALVEKGYSRKYCKPCSEDIRAQRRRATDQKK